MVEGVVKGVVEGVATLVNSVDVLAIGVVVMMEVATG